MTVEHRVGDLFSQPDLAAIGHGVNCKGKMGAGIAVLFRRKFATMHREYVELCEQNKLHLGEIFPYHDEATGLWVFNMASQHYPGPDARLKAVEETVEKVVKFCEENGIPSVGLPHIGCGIGGLELPDVVEVIQQVAGASPVKVVLVELG